MSDPNPSVPPEPVDPADQTLESPGAPEDFADLGKILAIIPTYNESGNIERITARVRAAVPSAHIWSPMTTALMAPERSQTRSQTRTITFTSCIDSARKASARLISLDSLGALRTVLMS